MKFLDIINEVEQNEITRPLSDLIRNFPLPLFIVDENKIIEYFNKEFTDLTGYDNDLKGRDVSYIDFKFENYSFGDMETFLNTTSKWNGKIELRKRNGELLSLHFYINTLRNSEGKIKFYTFFQKETSQVVANSDFNENEKRYKGILENVNEYIYSVYFENNKPVKTFHSPRCVEIVGYTSEELEGSDSLWYDMIFDEDKKRVLNFLHNMNVFGGKSNIEHRIVTKKGELKWVSNSCTVTKDENSDTKYLDGFIQDISERKKTLLRLQQLSRAVEQSPASVVITDQDGNIEYVNPKFTRLTGYTYQEAIGENPRILKSGFQSKEFYKKMWNTITSGKEWVGEFHNRKKSGALYWEWASISPLRDAKGEVQNYIAVKEDITELKDIESKLRERELQLSQKNDSFKKELYYAQQVQRAFLPLFAPKSEIVEIKYIFQPLDAVGGDIFKFFPDDEGIAIFTGDVVGHGVAAALFLALLNYITENIAKVYKRESDKFITELGNVLFKAMVNHFITAIYCFFERVEDGILLHYSNGGHPPAIIYRHETGKAEIIRAKGTILGMFDDVSYKKREVLLNKNDFVFLYTDGLPETENENGDIVGYDELIEIIENSYSSDITKTLNNIRDRIDTFRGDTAPSDDLLIIGVKILW